MPTDWQNFELECTDYLRQRYGTYANFTHYGNADSTKPDILVNTQHGSDFYIEVKHCPAQCGQFVLLPDDDTQTYQYSPRNPTPQTAGANIIIILGQGYG